MGVEKSRPLFSVDLTRQFIVTPDEDQVMSQLRLTVTFPTTSERRAIRANHKW